MFGKVPTATDLFKHSVQTLVFTLCNINSKNIVVITIDNLDTCIAFFLFRLSKSDKHYGFFFYSYFLAFFREH